MFLDAATFVFSAAMISRVPIPPSSARLTGRLDFSRIWRDMGDGIRFLREDSIASAMTAGIVVAFSAVGAVLALAPLFVVRESRRRRRGLGIHGHLVRRRDRSRDGEREPGLASHRTCLALPVVHRRGRRHAVRAGGDAQPRPRRRRHRLARCLLRAGLGDRLHLVAGERPRRVPGADVRLAHGPVPDGVVPLPRHVPYAGRCLWHIGGRLRARDPTGARDRGRGGGDRRAQHVASPQALPALPSAAPHPRAEAEAAPRDRVLHRLRGRRGIREGNPGPHGGGVHALAGLRRAGHARARGNGGRRAGARPAPRPRDREARRDGPRRSCSPRPARRRSIR